VPQLKEVDEATWRNTVALRFKTLMVALLFLKTQKTLGHDFQGNPGISLAIQAINW